MLSFNSDYKGELIFMKKNVVKTTIAFLIATSFFYMGIGVKASAKASEVKQESGISHIGGYAVTEQVGKSIKVYISSDVVDFVKSTGRIVYTEDIKLLGIIPSKNYYYYANEFVEKMYR